MKTIDCIPIYDQSQVRGVIALGRESALPNLRSMSLGYRGQASRAGMAHQDRERFTRAADAIDGFVDAASILSSEKAFFDGAAVFFATDLPSYKVKDSTPAPGSPRAQADIAYQQMCRDMNRDGGGHD